LASDLKPIANYTQQVREKIEKERKMENNEKGKKSNGWI